VLPAFSTRDVRRFVRFPHSIYRHDRLWVPPIRSQVARRLDVERNPFYATARRQLFLAWRGGAVVGTVAAIIDDARNAEVAEAVGYFGFFEATDSAEVVGALLESASRWLTAAGATTIRGPINGSSSDEIGLLIEGFGTRPALWQGHHPPYYRRLLEGLPLTRFDDVLALELTSADIGGSMDNLPGFLAAAAEDARHSGVTVRSPTRGSWSDDVAIAHRLYALSHRTLTGHGAMSQAQFSSIANSLRRVVDADLTLLAEFDGEPIGFAIAVPEVNEALARHPFVRRPWAAPVLLRALRRVNTASVKLVGVLPEHRNRGTGSLLCRELGSRLISKGYERCDMSLVSERNVGMTSLLTGLGARVYRRYRVYEAPLPLRR
jgi:GNAT superfamily N-acetyltransferase